MKRNILCMETAYDFRHYNRSTVLPLLDLLERVEEIRTVHFSCNTLGEWKFNLSRFDLRANFKIFYYAGHGESQHICLANNDSISLDELAEQMQGRFRGWTIHLGGCEILKGANKLAEQFLEKTGVVLVTGYTKQIEWIPSAALDLLWLSALQSPDEPKEIWEQFRGNYAGLIKSNGMVAIARE